MQQDLPPQAAILKLVTGFWAARSVSAFARLGVADHLAERALTATDLAAAMGLDGSALERLLRAVAVAGVVTRAGEAHYKLTPEGACLRSDAPGSMRAMIASEMDQAHWQAWGQLEKSIQTGEPAFERVFGVGLWEYYSHQNPEEGELFAHSMTSFSSFEVAAIARSTYSFGDARVIVDVGGGLGTFLSAALRLAPQARGILFDQPDVIARAKPALEATGMGGRIEAVGGSFFDSVPKGGDCYLLKHILHDWNDPDCVRILRHIRAALAPAGRVVVAEMPIVADPASPAPLLDINMLVMTPGGRERTAEEYAALFEKADLKLTGVTPTDSPIAVVEARAR